MNAILEGLDLSPIAVEAIKQEYNESLNHYFRTKDLQVLLDLILRLSE